MFSGLVSLLVAADVSQAELETRTISDAYYASQTSTKYLVTYDVSTRGDITGNLADFKKIIADTFADNRGWVRAGVKFEEVESGGKLHMVLASPAEVKAISPSGCSDTLSCTVKPYVLINDTRWMHGSDSYNALGVSLLSYRQMVINHEVGHFLGHNHIASCETDTGLAPIMLQQSTGVRGCTANSWPLPSELWVKGI